MAARRTPAPPLTSPAPSVISPTNSSQTASPPITISQRPPTRIYSEGVPTKTPENSTSIKPMTEPFDLTRFHRLLQTETLGRDLIFEPSVPSTMDLARDAALHAAPEGLVALADEQTAGRGR